MALVAYSDSEASDDEAQQPVAPTTTSRRLERTDGKKIRVDLTNLQKDSSNDTPEEPASKRQRTSGAFSGFNSLLPAPKRTAQSALKPGISLKTSSEAAFSRVPPPRLEPVRSSRDDAEDTRDATAVIAEPAAQEQEPKLIGKTTRFLPLSVANAKKKRRPPAHVAPQDAVGTTKLRPTSTVDPEPAAPQPKPKQSLFSMGADNDTLTASTQPYEPEFVQSKQPQEQVTTTGITPIVSDHSIQNNPLQAVATDLNLSASERRRLFGRHGDQAAATVAHFDMDSEYRSNQDLAASGEAAEHRTVKAIAPGKHSLQQLVNNVRGQTDALEDKWAEGRRNRGETGNKYGW